MKILVLGADGYLGWPASLYFSHRGDEVIAVDNYFKRTAARELDCKPLFPCPDLTQRADMWESISGKKLSVHIGDVTNHKFLSTIFKEHRPEAVIHFAEQPSAPYSMIDRERAAFTVQNNLIGTLNIIYAVREYVPDCHIIKLGTMGEYGTPNIDIEEGWIEIEHKGRRDTFLFPRQASSLYHTTKIQDTDLLWFYVRTWGLRVTDLMQGPVYGISTDETDLDTRLMTHFHYDEIFGTVLNRFIVQSIAGHPLTVYGNGSQIRGYINIKDSIACLYIAAQNIPLPGELKVFNQITETFSVNQLAGKVRDVGAKLGYDIRITHIDNPRAEKEDHYYNPKYSALKELGLTAHPLTNEVIESFFRVVERFKINIHNDAMLRGISWR